MKVFSKEKYLRLYELTESDSPWVDECDGKPVVNGWIDCYVINDEWCIEKEDKPMKKYTMKDFIEKKIAVKLIGQDEQRKFLELCDKEGLVWASGTKATKFDPCCNDVEIVCGWNNSERYAERLTWSYLGHHETHGWTVVPFAAITYETTPTYEIHIKCVGDVTTAEMVVNGKAVKSSKAKRDPRDKFSFKTGAEYAFNRLFEKKEKEVTPEKFKIGDRVKTLAPWSGNRNIVGKTGTIVDISSFACLVRFDVDIDGHGEGDRNWWVPMFESKLLIKINEEFKIGDVVKCISPHDDNEMTVGKIGVIVDINPRGDHWQVEFKQKCTPFGDPYKWWLKAENLVHV